MRRVICLLLAVAGLNSWSVAPTAWARQAPTTQPKSTIKGKDLGKALANPGVKVYFWAPGAFTLLGTVDANGEVFYTPGSAPSSVTTTSCGATYASLQKWCPFPITAHAVKCGSGFNAGPLAPVVAPLELAEGDEPAVESAGGQRFPQTIVVLVPTADKQKFSAAVGGGAAPPAMSCEKSTHEIGIFTFSDDVVLDGSSGDLMLSINKPGSASTPDSGDSHTTLYVVGGGTAAAIVGYLALRGSSSSSTGPVTTPGVTLPSEQTVIDRSDSLQGSLSGGSTTCGPPTEQILVTFSGNATSTVALITGGLPGITGATVPGSVSSTTSSNFQFSGSSSNITMNLAFAVSSDGTTVTVTGTVAVTGSCPVTYTVNATYKV